LNVVFVQAVWDVQGASTLLTAVYVACLVETPRLGDELYRVAHELVQAKPHACIAWYRGEREKKKSVFVFHPLQTKVRGGMLLSGDWQVRHGATLLSPLHID
jgi:hypothetical protein